MKNTIITSLICAMASQYTIAQTINKEKLDTYFNQLEKHNKFMGSVAVSKEGKLLYTKTVGYADYSNKIKATDDYKYRIGSISKTFTAVLVLQAVEQGKLTLETTLDTYFPTIKNANKITVAHLLNHTSGIHNFTDDALFLDWNTKRKTQQEMVSIIEKGGSDFEPNSKPSYSNSNYVLLTYILEKVNKDSYAEILQKNIIKPLNLKNTYLGNSIQVQNKEVKSYSYSDGWKLETETDLSIPVGAGAVVSNPKDLILFSEALFGGKLLQPSSLKIMKTFKESYGSGLFEFPFSEHQGYGHNGGIDGFSSIFSYFDTDKITYAMTSNGANTNTNSISLLVLSEVFGKPYEIPEFTTYNVRSEDLDVYLGNYSSTELPIKITITKDAATLIAQATGQSSFPLEATKKDVFSFDMAGILLEFNTAQKTLVLKQGGGTFTFTKE